MFFRTEDLGGALKKDQGGFLRSKALFIALLFFILLWLGAYLLLDAQSSKKMIYSKEFTVFLQDNFTLLAKLQVFSQKQATMDDALYCGFRVGKIYQSTAKLLLLDSGKVLDFLDLTNPELVLFDFNEKYLDYYKPWDIDGDGKSQEFIVQAYANCNGNLLSFVKADIVLFNSSR